MPAISVHRPMIADIICRFSISCLGKKITDGGSWKASAMSSIVDLWKS